MNTEQFFQFVALFVDSPDALQRQHNRFVMQTSEGDLIEGTLSRSGDSLIVEESGTKTTALRWISQRLAKVDRLASRIKTVLAEERQIFVATSGKIIDDLASAPSDDEQATMDVLQTLDHLLDRRPAGVSSLVYLTSHAGEGKTRTIDELALRRAKLFSENSSAWLLVPISLSGKPFLRFDDVVVATLANRFRFLGLFYRPFIELVRYGLIVPAFDGFEEMFVETPSGDAVSALGGFLSDLQGEGTTLIAARSAYFEYRRLNTQARLFDSIRGLSVSFSRISIDRWQRDHFMEYCVERGLNFDEASNLHGAVASRLGDSHPILTRPVLAKRLVDIVEESGSIETLLNKLGTSPSDYFAEFVRGIVEREAGKWLDKAEGPREAIFSASEHEELLSQVAREMWMSRSETLGADILETIAQLYCDQQQVPPARSRQVLERIKDHALLRQALTGARSQFAFDHEEFYQFFLGRSISLVARQEPASDLRNLLRRGLLPESSIHEAVADLQRSDTASAMQLIARVVEVVASEPSISYARENAGALVRPLLSLREEPLSVVGLIFGNDALKSMNVTNVRFENCTFGPTSLAGTTLTRVHFDACSLQDVELSNSTTVTESTIGADTEVFAVVPDGWDTTIYAPAAISEYLRRAGFSIEQGSVLDSDSMAATLVVDPDEKLRVLERVIRAFFRSTEVNETTFRQRLGVHSALFVDVLLPDLLAIGVLEDVPYRGRGTQRRFRVRCSLQTLRKTLEESDGRYEKFLVAFKSGAK